MPVTRLTCPHCETKVELTVTSVTRSRECPHCGKMIILQFTTKETRIKRKALLMPADTEEDTSAALPGAVAAGAGEPPRVLGPDVHRRMLHDPEVQSNARRLGWGVAFVGALIAVIVAGNYFKWWTPEPDSKTTPPSAEVTSKGPAPSKGLPTLEEAKAMEATATTIAPPVATRPAPAPSGNDQENARAAVNSFLAAKTVDERLSFVLDRETMEPKIRAYYTKNKDGAVAHTQVKDMQVDAEGPSSFAYNVVLSPGKVRRIVVAPKTGGGYGVDWPSFVLYGDMEWAELMEKKPRVPVLMRVLVKADDYYNHNFGDARSLGCLRLYDPKNDDSPAIFAYYARTTTLGREMEFMMRRAFGEAVSMTLTLNFPEDPQSDNQVWLDERLAEGWVLTGH